MKSNLKEQVANLQKELQELTKRFGTLQDRIENYLVPRLQHHDNDLIECKTANSFLTGIQNAVMKLEDWRNSLTPKACGYCKWIKIVRNEDQQTIGICNNPKSIQYNHEVLAEENCFGFVPKPEIVVEELEDDSK